MPSDDDYATEVIRTVTELTLRFEAVGQQLALHRDVVFRAINLLNHEVVDLAGRFDKDDAARQQRQQQIDAKLETITNGQQQIRRWQWIRVIVEIAAILVIAAFFYGVSR